MHEWSLIGREPELNLVHLLVSRRQARVVATARSDTPIPPTILDLWQDDHLHRLGLGALDAADSGRLVEAIVGAPAEAAVQAELHRRSEGLPLGAAGGPVRTLVRGTFLRDGGKVAVVLAG